MRTAPSISTQKIQDLQNTLALAGKKLARLQTLALRVTQRRDKLHTDKILQRFKQT